MIFGANENKGMILQGSNFQVVEIGDSYSKDDILVHDRQDKNLAMLLSEITYTPNLPVPIGILYQEDKPSYDKMLRDQIENAIKIKGKGDLKNVLLGTNHWEVS